MTGFIDRRRPLDRVQETRFLGFIPAALAVRGSVALRAFVGISADHVERRAWRWLDRESSDSGGDS